MRKDLSSRLPRNHMANAVLQRLDSSKKTTALAGIIVIVKNAG
jgi:hypothetical protein